MSKGGVPPDIDAVTFGVPPDQIWGVRKGGQKGPKRAKRGSGGVPGTLQNVVLGGPGGVLGPPETPPGGVPGGPGTPKTPPLKIDRFFLSPPCTQVFSRAHFAYRPTGTGAKKRAKSTPRPPESVYTRVFGRSRDPPVEGGVPPKTTFWRVPGGCRLTEITLNARVRDTKNVVKGQFYAHFVPKGPKSPTSMSI